MTTVFCNGTGGGGTGNAEGKDTKRRLCGAALTPPPDKSVETLDNVNTSEEEEENEEEEEEAIPCIVTSMCTGEPSPNKSIFSIGPSFIREIVRSFVSMLGSNTPMM